jgi:hypothetical protein
MATGTYPSTLQVVGSTVESLGSNAGFVCIKEQSFSATATVQVYDVFSREYDDYLMLLNATSSVTNQYLAMNTLKNTTTVANTWQSAGQWMYYGSGAIGNWSSSVAPGAYCGYVAAPSTTNPTICQMIIRSPFISGIHTTTEQIFDMGGLYIGWGASRSQDSLNYNGFQITQVGGGNLTGNVFVYGMRRS